MPENKYPFISYSREFTSPEEMIKRSEKFYNFTDSRRTVRDFSDKSVPKEVIENIILTASTAPSGAHKQTCTFCVISNKELKSKIRKMAEEK